MTSLSSFVDLPLDEQQARGLQFTPREIAQQPDTWLTTVRIFQEEQARICRFLEEVGLLQPIESRPVVLLVGAGTSDYIGQSLAPLLREKWGCEVAAYPSTELLTNMDEYIVPGRQYLWISFSRSGDSPEGVAVLEQALDRYPEVAHLVVTCNADARMASITREATRACVVVLDDAVNDRSLAMTSSFTNMIVMGQCLAHAWATEEYVSLMGHLVAAGRDFLHTAADEAESVSAQGLPRACFVGSGALAGVAKEAALKVLEMTAGDVKTMAETVLGLRHGPMAALDTETLFICFASSDERRQRYAADLMYEISAKQITGRRIVVGPHAAKALFAASCDRYLAVPDGIADGYRPILDVMFGQLLGLYSSIARKMKPDAPSPGGVINRVVQEFRIY
ncbi:SIS domain-containing protein [Acidipila sp. EB88]|uniref:SIS domain-containing protein n=1 Tax=Acidipila sp. EB88 TaxID=2305226 RepID=UPI000F5F5978|nr:SIS domain-containing protein [Acidipila sp. EB88]RRA49830.1 SIS domain-containing protein [Acidipila sp. EB88]